MLTFLSPLWLTATALVALVGIVALWRGSRHRQLVSSSLLWRGLETAAAGQRQRRLDPLWLLLLLAAILAASALARPTLIRGPRRAEPRAELLASMRALPGQPHAELLAKITSGAHLPETLQLSLDAAAPQTLSRAELLAGKLLPLPKADRIVLRLHAGPRLLSEQTLARVLQPPLAVFTRGRVSPALRRVMEIQPGAQVHAAAPGRALTVLLLGPGPTSALDRLPERDALVVFTGDAAPAELGLRPAAPGWVNTPAPLRGQVPALAALQDRVLVRSVRAVDLAPEWSILARAGAHPFLALRREPSANLAYLYIASTLAPEQTDWPADPSFVMFFADVLESLRPAAGTAALEEWLTTPHPLPPAGTPREYALAALLLVSALLLTVLVQILVWRRGAAPRRESARPAEPRP